MKIFFLPYLELVVGSLRMVRSDVRSCMLLDLMLSDSSIVYVRVFSSIVSNL